MELKTIVGVLILTGLANTAFASGYFPPERISCSQEEGGKVSCNDFNRNYLTEDTTNANFQKGKDKIFNFVSGVALVHKFRDKIVYSQIFYTYMDDSHHNVINLKTINPNIYPDFNNSDWEKLNDKTYTCETSYMRCSITDDFT